MQSSPYPYSLKAELIIKILKFVKLSLVNLASGSAQALSNENCENVRISFFPSLPLNLVCQTRANHVSCMVPTLTNVEKQEYCAVAFIF